MNRPDLRTLAATSALVCALVSAADARQQSPAQTPVTAQAPGDAAQAPVHVQLLGETLKPGLYELPAGSRLSELLRRDGVISNNRIAQAILNLSGNVFLTHMPAGDTPAHSYRIGHSYRIALTPAPDGTGTLSLGADPVLLDGDRVYLTAKSGRKEYVTPQF